VQTGMMRAAGSPFQRFAPRRLFPDHRPRCATSPARPRCTCSKAWSLQRISLALPSFDVSIKDARNLHTYHGLCGLNYNAVAKWSPCPNPPTLVLALHTRRIP